MMVRPRKNRKEESESPAEIIEEEIPTEETTTEDAGSGYPPDATESPKKRNRRNAVSRNKAFRKRPWYAHYIYV